MNLSILKYVFFDLLRSRFVISYGLILALISLGISYFSRDELKVSLAMLNIVLFVVPLVSIIFGSIHFYDSGEFIEFLLTQPVSRSTVFRAEFIGLGLALSFAVVAGLLPVAVFSGISSSVLLLMVIAVLLTFIFCGIAFLSASVNTEKVRGIGLSIIVWLFMAVIFDLIVMLAIFTLRDYPLEKFMLIFTSLNPIDLSRILLLLKTDVSAMMGFTGASFREFFGSAAGMAVAGLALMLWILIPYFASKRLFRKKNF